MHLPAPIQDLIDAFSYLPGIGPKTASRLTFYLLQGPEELSQNLASALQGIKSGTDYCPNCFNIMETGREMAVQVGNDVAEDLVIHLHGVKYLPECLGSAHHVVEKQHAFLN